MGWISVLTNTGIAYMGSLFNSNTLTLTAAACGSGYVPDANMRIATDLNNYKMAASIVSRREIENGVEIRVRVGPASAAVGAFVCHEIGIWGKYNNGTPEMVILCQDSAAGISVPTESTSNEFAFDLFIPTVCSNTENLTVTLDGDVYVTEDEFDAALDDKADKTDTVLVSTLSRGRKTGTTVGTGSNAFGQNVEASGYYSHAEGDTTQATGMDAHAEGNGTIANHLAQHAGGEYNVADPSSNASISRGNYAEIIGNGTGSSARSNARALDWSGNERLAGDVYVGCNDDSSGGFSLHDGIENLNGAIAYIVVGNRSTVNIAAGAYVAVKGSTITGINDGLYTAAAAITANTTITSASLTAVTGGGFNAVTDAMKNRIIKCDTAVAIPSAGTSVSKNLSGLTADHELIRWDFSSSAENSPPCSLTITTYAGYFTLTNNGGTTSETVTPVFALPTAKAVSNHT